MTDHKEDAGKTLPYWIISHGSEDIWYVSEHPDIRFTKLINEAARMSKAEAIESLSVLADMQRSSSSSEPEVYSLVCVKK